MKSLILYGSRVKLTKAHKPVHTKAAPPNGEPRPDYFVRMKVVDCNFEQALSFAKPQVGETILNTVPID